MSIAVIAICLVLLGTSAVVVLGRMTVGPTILDRAVAFDALVAITIVGLALDAAVRRSTDTITLLLVLTLLGFIGSVAVARFIDPRDVDDEEAPS